MADRGAAPAADDRVLSILDDAYAALFATAAHDPEGTAAPQAREDAKERDNAACCLLYLCGCPVRGATERALEEVERWCGMGETRSALVRQGIVEALLPLLASGRGGDGQGVRSSYVTRMVTSAFEQVALEDDAAVHEALQIAVAPLVRLISHEVPADDVDLGLAIDSAASTLRNMARQPSMRALIVDESALAPLLKLIAVPEPESEANDDAPVASSASARARESSVSELIARLAAEKQCRSHVMRAGAPAVLIQLCNSSGNPIVAANAAGALVNLAADKGNRPQIVSAGAIPPLVKLCGRNDDKMVRANATQALSSLAKHTPARAAMIQAGVAAPLLTICRDPSDSNILRFTMRIVAALMSEGPDARKEFLDTVPVIVRVCSEALSGEPRGEEKQLVKACLEILAQLAEDADNLADISTAGTIPVVISHCARTDDATSCAYAAWAINGIAAHVPSRMELVNEGAAPALLAVMSAIQEPHVQRDCAAALQALAQESGATPLLVDAGAVEGLSQLTSATSNDEVHEIASSALVHLASHGGPLGVADAVRSIVNPLVRLCTGAENMDVLLCTTRVLRALANHDPAAADEMAKLCDATEVQRRGNLLLATMQALEHMVDSGALRPRLVEAGIVVTLLSIASKHEEEQIRGFIALIVASLAQDYQSTKTMVESRATELLCLLCGAGKGNDGNIVLPCVSALCDLAAAEGCRSMMAADGAVHTPAGVC
eukprot:g7628.t1